MGNHRPIAVLLRHLDGVHGLADRTDLVHLDEDCIGHMQLDARIQTFRIGHKEIVAHQLDLIAQAFADRGRSGKRGVL